MFMDEEMEHDTSSSKDRDRKSLNFAGFKDGQETFQFYVFQHLNTRLQNIYIYSILHILTIVFPDTHNVEYLPIFHRSYSRYT